MKTAIVTAELNPLHNGHAGLFQAVKSSRSADALIVVMSGSFVQRGEPAVIDKHRRARAALLSGADLVIELPLIYSLAPAEIFARGAVITANAVSDEGELIFGSESGDESGLSALASRIDCPERDWRPALNRYIKQGLSYPAAMEKALSEGSLENAAAAGLLENPNDMLGVEYIRSLKLTGSRLRPVPVKRTSGGDIPHASELRQLILDNERGEAPEDALTALRAGMPESSFDELLSVLSSYIERPLFSDSLSAALSYRLSMTEPEELSRFGDMNRDLANRICSLFLEYSSFERFLMAVKNKAFTLARIRRSLTQLLLGIERGLRDEALDKNATFLRVLGFRESARALLGSVKARAESLNVPLLLRGADMHSNMIKSDPVLRELIRLELNADSLYEQLRLTSGRRREEEKPPVIVKNA